MGEGRETLVTPCEAGPHRPHFVSIAILRDAPTGHVCVACGNTVEVDAGGLTLPHYRLDVRAMLERGDFGA